jgi:hypothetical protein
MAAFDARDPLSRPSAIGQLWSIVDVDGSGLVCMSQVTIILGNNVQTLGNFVQVDWQFGRTAICPKQTILMALNSHLDSALPD